MVDSKDIQRLFLQSMISRRVASQKMAKLLWKKAVEAVKAVDDSIDIEYTPSSEGWPDFLTRLNESMNSLDLEIVALHDESTGIPTHALVNRRGDDLAQIASDYSPAELAYFKALIDMIMTAPNYSYCISSLGALRELSSLKTNMTKSQGELILNSFVARGWLMKSRQGKYSLSARTSLELQPYIKSTYPDAILECTICFEMVTRGIRCYVENCKCVMHHHCYNNYIRGGKTTCTTCMKPWGKNKPEVKPVGEAAYKDNQEQHRSRTRRRANDYESDGDEEFYEDDEAGPSQSTQGPPKTQSKTKSKSKKSAAHVETMRVDEEEDGTGEEEESRTQPKRKSRR